MKKDNTVHKLSPEELRKLQLVLLEMLLELDRICKKHDITYTLIGGTCLGAVRHGGFIPWDDDLDIGMLRSEYDRFRKACETDMDSAKYFFQDDTTDPHYRWGYGRIRRKNSKFVRLGQEHMQMVTGIFLDIFPLDAVPEFYPMRLIHASYCFLLRKVLYAQAGKITGKNALIRGVYALLEHIPTAFVFRRLEKLRNFWNKRPSMWVRTYAFPTPDMRLAFERAWYENVSDIAFEGHMLHCVTDYTGYLTYKYGPDYMTLPPPEKRFWHPASSFALPKEGE